MKFFCVLLLLSASVCAQTRPESLEFFDEPVKEVLDLGPSPYYLPSQHIRKKLTCSIYPTFMVKEYDEGQKGAEWLSILRFKPENRPACSLAHLRNERVIRSKEWSGYFKGAKGSFALFDAPDGVNEGMPFAVYDTRTGQKLFEDSAYLSSANRAPASSKVFSVSLDDKHRLILRYLRVVSAGCDLNRNGASCWKDVRTKYGILESKQPVCTDYVEGYFGEWESALGYPASVVFSEYPQVRALDGPVFCWPVD